MNRKLALALLAASVTSGCSLTLDAEEVAPWENAENWCYAAIDLLVELEATCSPMTPAYEDYQYHLFTEAFLDCGYLGQAEDAGRIRFDSGAAKRCLEQLAAGDCFADQEACEWAVQGAVHAGGACTSYRDCAADTTGCDFSLSCPGTCGPLGELGAPCNDDGECTSGLYCAPSGAYTCQLRVGALETCAVGDPPTKCPDGYYCGNDGLQRCLPRPVLGQFCDGSIPCDDRLELACDPYTFQCVNMPVPPSPIGGRCAWPYHCDEANAFCDGSSCQPRRPLDLGNPCDYDDQCAFPGSCNYAPGTGETNPTCKSIRRLGESCWGGRNQCLEGAYCDAPYDVQGICRAQPVLGQSCYSPAAAESITCLGGTCNGSLGPAATCVPYAGLGDTCNEPGSVPCDFLAGLTCDPGSSTCVASVCGGAFF